MIRSSTAFVVAAAFAALTCPRASAQRDPGKADPACPPAARVGGADELARRVKLELAVLGVRTEALRPDCPSVRVVVAEVAGGVSVALEDPSGRRARQVVTTPHVAATWIESWLHPELRDPLLASRAGLDRAAGPSIALAGAPAGLAGAATGPLAADLSDAAPAHPPLRFRGFLVSAAGEKLYASDETEWRAITMSACARWGPLCSGLIAHVADGRDLLVDGFADLDRLDVDLLASLAAPFDVGRMRIAPGLAFGLGVLRSSRATCVATDPATGTTGCGDPRSVTYTIGPRAEMGLDAAFPIASRLSLVVSGALGFAPMARGQPIPGPDPGPDGSLPGGENSDDSGPDGQSSSTDPALPGEPSQFTRVGVGLALELP